MPLQLSSRTAILEGVVTVEEAEPLAAWLRTTQAPRVNLKSVTSLHTAALQALVSAGVKVTVAPTDDFYRTWVAPLLTNTTAAEDDR